MDAIFIALFINPILKFKILFPLQLGTVIIHMCSNTPNPALNLAHFVRWTALKRRWLALR